MPMTGFKKRKPIRYLLYLALVTSVIASVTLAKFTKKADSTAQAMIASFATGMTIRQDVSLDGLLAPGDQKVVEFSVTNYEGDKNSDVPLTYEIQVRTTGNLPLKFALRGQKESEDTDVDNSALAGSLDESLLASGGLMPSAAVGGKKVHTYWLTISWPEEEADPGYSDEIDQVELEITASQRGA